MPVQVSMPLQCIDPPPSSCKPGHTGSQHLPLLLQGTLCQALLRCLHCILGPKERYRVAALTALAAVRRLLAVPQLVEGPDHAGQTSQRLQSLHMLGPAGSSPCCSSGRCLLKPSDDWECVPGVVKLADDWAVCPRCGSAEGLDAGRHCLQKWGFRRCEDICWIKANTSKQDKGASIHQDFHSTLQHTKVCPGPGVVVPGVLVEGGPCMAHCEVGSMLVQGCMQVLWGVDGSQGHTLLFKSPAADAQDDRIAMPHC